MSPRSANEITKNVLALDFLLRMVLYGYSGGTQALDIVRVTRGNGKGGGG